MKPEEKEFERGPPDLYPAADKKKIFLSSPHMSEEGHELEFVKQAFRSNWLAPLGPNVDSFEEEFSKKTGASSCAALSSGTAALHMALRAAGVTKNDTVLCSSFTFSASANPVIYENAVPVFIDSDYRTWNMCPSALESALKKHNPRAVIAVHLYGLPASLSEISALCEKHGAVLIEDAAESLGSRYDGKHTGTTGDYGVFSFNSNKIITTSGGGMLAGRDPEKIEKVKFWAAQSRDPARHYQHSELGFNYRLSNVLAGIGRGQLRVLDERIERKKYIFEFYRRELEGLDGVSMMPVPEMTNPNFWLTCVTLAGKASPLDVILALEEENIEARPLWKPLHLQPFFYGCDFSGSGVCEDLFKRGVCLPSDTKMTDDDLGRATGTIKKLWK